MSTKSLRNGNGVHDDTDVEEELSPLGIYIAQIQKEPLLGMEEEKQHQKSIFGVHRALDDAKILRLPLCLKAEKETMQRLIALVEDGNSARGQVVSKKLEYIDMRDALLHRMREGLEARRRLAMLASKCAQACKDESREMWQHIADVLRNEAGEKEAGDRLILGNMALVVNLAKRVATSSYPLDEAIGDGNLTLVHAIDKFRDQHTRFATFGGKAALHVMNDRKMHNSVVRIPQYLLELIPILRTTEQRLFAKNNAVPTFEEVLSTCQQEKRGVFSRQAIKQQDIKVILKGLFQHGGYTPVASDRAEVERTAFMDDVPDPSHDDPSETACDQEVPGAKVERLLSMLDEQRRSMLQMYFGIDRERMTYREIGKSLGLSRETVRLAVRDALKELREMEGAEHAA